MAVQHAVKVIENKHLATVETRARPVMIIPGISSNGLIGSLFFTEQERGESTFGRALNYSSAFLM